jgi:DNA-binding transcriptional regulator YiaG
MNTEWREAYRAALGRINVADYARWAGRPYRTVQDWRRGQRQPPPGALRELVRYLHDHATTLAATADQLEAVAPEEEA